MFAQVKGFWLYTEAIVLSSLTSIDCQANLNTRSRRNHKNQEHIHVSDYRTRVTSLYPVIIALLN